MMLDHDAQRAAKPQKGVYWHMPFAASGACGACRWRTYVLNLGYKPLFGLVYWCAAGQAFGLALLHLMGCNCWGL